MRVVVLRACPVCGGDPFAVAGGAWMSCRACPTAFDPFGEGEERIQTFHPAGETEIATDRLPFHFITLGAGGKTRVAWIPAFLSAGSTFAEGPGAELTKRQYDPALREAPLGCPLLRGPLEAKKLLDAMETADAPSEILMHRLVSLACERRDQGLMEMVTRVFVPVSQLRPAAGRR